MSAGGILIVDDSVEILRALATIIKRAGLVPRPVTSGKLAIEAAIAEPPSLVLLDMQMPDMSGLSVCRCFKQDTRLQSIPIIFVSGQHRPDEKVEAFLAGAVDYVTKPFHEEEVLARISTHLRIQELQRQLELQNERLAVDRRWANERATLVSSSTRDALIILDNSGNISDWNSAAEDTFGWARAEVLGKQLHSLLAPERFQAAHLAAWSRFRATGQGEAIGKTLELAALRKSGEEFPIELSIIPTILNDCWCAVGVVRDITERKRAEAKLQHEVTERHKMELELRHAQKLEVVGQLAAGIAHEINTPTQFLGDNIQFLKEAFDGLVRLSKECHAAVVQLGQAAENQPIFDGLRMIEHEIDLGYITENAPIAFERCIDGVSRIALIVRSMKEFAHNDQREQGAADINRALKATLVIARNEYKYVADVATEFAELPPVVCHLGDLNQVFLNLIVNAAHAVGDKVGRSGDKGEIRIKTAISGDQVRIDISDSGTGISDSARQHLFEPFFTTKEIGRGTGQGLAISRAIVCERHGGSITFESQLGIGTTFTLLIPVQGKNP